MAKKSVWMAGTAETGTSYGGVAGTGTTYGSSTAESDDVLASGDATAFSATDDLETAEERSSRGG